MRATTVGGLALVLLGILALLYQGISYTKTEKLIDLGPIQATTETRETIPLPPVVGGFALVAGVVLLVLGSRRSDGKSIL